jgi:16S rRNA G966 N2-methylase RsmD
VQGRTKTNSPTFGDYCTKILGQPESTVRDTLDTVRALREAKQTALLALLDQRKIAVSAAKQEWKRMQRRAGAVEYPSDATPEQIDAAFRFAIDNIHDASAVDLIRAQPDQSIALIYADTPYTPDFIPQLAEIAAAAEPKLSLPRGVFAVMTGKRDMAGTSEVLRHVQQTIKHHWTIAYLKGYRGVKVRDRGVTTGWSPVFVFSNAAPHYIGRDVVAWDIVMCPEDVPSAEELLYHEHEQSLGGHIELFKRLVRPGDTVLDFCCGSGTSGIAAALWGCKPILGDSDRNAVRTTRRRLKETYAAWREALAEAEEDVA